MDAMSEVGVLTPTEFLLARLDEDEGAAHAVLEAVDHLSSEPAVPWSARDGRLYISGAISIGLKEEMAEHIARHDPARVLAEVAAKRAIVERCLLVIQAFDDGVMWSNVNRRERSHARMTIRTLAAVYADHPDYRDEWKP